MRTSAGMSSSFVAPTSGCSSRPSTVSIAHLLDVLVGAVHRVARLEPDDRLPAPLGESGARLFGVAAMLQELGVLLALEQPDRPADQHLALGVHRCDAGVGVLLRAVSEARLFLLVVLEGLLHVHDRQEVARLICQRYLLAFVRLRVLLRGRQRHGQRPRHAAGEVHVLQHGLVVGAAHEARQRAERANGDHLEVG